MWEGLHFSTIRRFTLQDAQDGLKMAPRGAQEPPRGPQEAPRELQEAPRGPQDAPRRPQDGPKTAPRRLQVAPKSHAKTTLCQLNFNISRDPSKIPLGPPSGSPKRPQRSPQEAPRDPQRPPRDPQEPPKRPPRGHIFSMKINISCGRGCNSHLSYQVACNMSPLGRRRGPALRAESGGVRPLCQIPLGLTLQK